MYIEKIKINKFRVLEDIEVVFQPPGLGGSTADPETGRYHFSSILAFQS